MYARKWVYFLHKNMIFFSICDATQNIDDDRIDANTVSRHHHRLVEHSAVFCRLYNWIRKFFRVKRLRCLLECKSTRNENVISVVAVFKYVCNVLMCVKPDAIFFIETRHRSPRLFTTHTRIYNPNAQFTLHITCHFLLTMTCAYTHTHTHLFSRLPHR